MIDVSATDVAGVMETTIKLGVLARILIFLVSPTLPWIRDSHPCTSSEQGRVADTAVDWASRWGQSNHGGVGNLIECAVSGFPIRCCPRAQRDRRGVLTGYRGSCTALRGEKKEKGRHLCAILSRRSKFLETPSVSPKRRGPETRLEPALRYKHWWPISD